MLPVTPQPHIGAGISPARILHDVDSTNYMAVSDSILPLLTTSATRNDFRGSFTRLTGTFLPYGGDGWNRTNFVKRRHLLTFSKFIPTNGDPYWIRTSDSSVRG